MALFCLRKVVDTNILPINHLIAVCLQTVGDDNITTSQDRIIAYSLGVYPTIDLHLRLLALNDDMGRATSIHNYNIGTLCHTIDCYRILLGDAMCREAAPSNKISNDVSTHPLLGSEHKPATTYGIEDLTLAIGGATSS
jgi:hypothetical protein